MSRKKFWLALVAAMAILAIVAACAQPTPTAAPKPTVAATQAVTVPTPAPTQIPPGTVIKEPPIPKVDPKPRIGIESAFGTELAKLLSATQVEVKYVINGRIFTTGKLMGNDVVLFLSGVSQGNAAMTTAQAVDYFNITHLVFSGIAGGVNPSIKIGDVVIPKQWASYQETTYVREITGKLECKSDLPPFGMACPANGVSVVQKGGDGDKASIVRWFPVDATMYNVAVKVADRVNKAGSIPLNKDKEIAAPLPDALAGCGKDREQRVVCLSERPKIIVGGNGVAGPTFVDNKAFREYTWDVFQADALDMETNNTALVTYNTKVPFLAFRSLSDLAGGGPGENEIGSFFAIAADNSAFVLMEFLKEWAIQTNKAPQPIQVSPPTPVGAACSRAGVEKVGKFQIPDVVKDKYNVAFMYVGPHDDAGWTQAHDLGRQYVEKNVPGVCTTYVELVPETGPDGEQVTRALARKGFNAIVGTTFGYMDAYEAVASEFPNVNFLHVSGFKFNGKNFGNMFGAMEDMKYLAGMIAGARLKADNQKVAGYVATFPIPEELRLGNAFAIGMKVTCPDCKLDVRWINTWHDPVKEKDGAASLFDAGAHVVFTGADTPVNAEVARNKKKYAITYDYVGNCTLDSCLTTIYWNWGPVYATDIKAMIAGKWKGGVEYFDADSGIVGIYGFMEGQKPQPGVPADVIPLVKAKLADMLAGKFTRFDVFVGPIKDNKGNTVVPAGTKITQCDIDQFKPGAKECPANFGMYWWYENVTAALPKLQ